MICKPTPEEIRELGLEDPGLVLLERQGGLRAALFTGWDPSESGREQEATRYWYNQTARRGDEPVSWENTFQGRIWLEQAASDKALSWSARRPADWRKTPSMLRAEQAAHALAARAAEHPNWTWLPGLQTTFGRLTTDPRGRVVLATNSESRMDAGKLRPDGLPVGIKPRFYRWLPGRQMEDHASVGCLLGVLIESVGDPGLSAVPPSEPSGTWEVWPGSPESSLPFPLATGASRVEALVNALYSGWTVLPEEPRTYAYEISP